METVERDKQKDYKIGLISVIICHVLWGFLPIYWKSLQPIDSFVIIFYRIVLMGLACFIACMYNYRSIKEVFRPMFESHKKTFIYVTAGIIITINWSIYIWAVNAGYVIQTSMGYFLEPLIVCLFGMIIYKERANNWKKLAMVFGLAGLLIVVIGYGKLPFIAVGLGLSFAIYAAIKKSVFISPIQSLLYETLFIMPVALVFIFVYEQNGTGAFQHSGVKIFLLMFAGLATAIPMGLFSFAANKLPLITLGLMEYISPSIALFLGIFLFHEAFDYIQFIAFVVIWVGLIFFTYGEMRDVKKINAEENIVE